LPCRSGQSTGLEQSRQRAQSKVREYLSVANCLQGLQLVSQSLFGISMYHATLGPDESWLRTGQIPTATDIDQDVLIQKFVVVDNSTNEILGTVFFDLFGRENKFPGAAHFTVQCGCARTSVQAQGSGNADSPLSEKQQLPIVALVFHFKAPSGGSSADLAHTLLSLREVETLHHEWGHALHSLLSKTRFQHLSGTRGGSDFVEVSSSSAE